MTESEKLERIISPEKFFPDDLRRGILLGNRRFIDPASRYLDILSESQFWPLGRLKEVQLRRLRNLILRITTRSSFWDDYFREKKFSLDTITFEGFQRFPVLQRKLLLGLGDKIFVPPLPEEPTFVRYSSGTTGIPLKFVDSERELIPILPFGFRHPVMEKFSWVDFFSRKPFVVLGMPGLRFYCEKDFFYRTFLNIKSPDLDDLKIRKEIYKSIYEAAPAILVGFGSLIAKLSYLVSEDAVKLPLLAVITQSEAIPPAEQENIKRALGVPIINILNANGVGQIGFECPGNPGRFHVNSENIILEVVGEDGIALPVGGEGELVATSLTKMLTPRIRWAQGDTGRLIPETCPCGRTLPLFEFHGRREYEVVLPSGKKVRTILLSSSLMRIGLGQKSKQIQIIQERPDYLRLLIIPKKPFDDSYEIKIRLALAELFYGEKVLVDIDYVENIPSIFGSSKPRLFVPLSAMNELQQKEAR